MGLFRQSWASGVHIEKKLGLLKNYRIMLPVSGCEIMTCLCVKILNCNNMPCEYPFE